jgi:hypothetical protein
MEVTDLKELKKLMKGEARNKFEFEEENEEDAEYDKSLLFSSYAGDRKGPLKTGETGTYKMSQPQNSIRQAPYGQEELSSSDSELNGQDDYTGGEDFNDDGMYDDDMGAGNRSKSSENKVFSHLSSLQVRTLGSEESLKRADHSHT